MNRRTRRMAQAKARAPHETLLTQAIAHHRAGELALALEGYRRVLEIAPRNVDALMNVGHLHTAEGRQSAALAAYRRALEAGPVHAGVHHHLANALCTFGRYDAALAHYAQAIALEPGRAEAHQDLGVALLEIGRKAEAIEALSRATIINPLLGAAYTQLARAAFDDRDPKAAIDALTRAVLSDAGDVWARFLLAVALDLSGNRKAADEHLASLHPDRAVFAGAADSWRYVREHRGPGTRFFTTTREVLLHALSHAGVEGMTLELGVRYGISTRWIAGATSGPVHGFDSFEGLPEDWHIQPKGIYSTHGEVPELPANVALHVGLFSDTLPPFVKETAGPIRFMNVDCDLYSSTRTALDALADRVVPGTVIVFDEYLLNDRWREDEFKAFQELVAERGWRYEYLAFGFPTGQAAVKILGG